MNTDNSSRRSTNHKTISKKDNAKQAFIELANAFGIKSEKIENHTGATIEASRALTLETLEITQSSNSTVVSDKTETSMLIHELPTDGKTIHSPTIISDSTVIIGNIQASGDIDVQGELKGDVSSGSSILITGKIVGNITAKKDINLKSAHIQGNIATEGDVIINKTSVVIGDICAKNITLNGHVKGKLSIDGLVSFQDNVMFLGDVSASRITMSEGAQLAGSVLINQEALSSAFEDIPV